MIILSIADFPVNAEVFKKNPLLLLFPGFIYALFCSDVKFDSTVPIPC